MAAAHTYDDIGVVYAQHRRADPRIAEQIRLALGDARTLVNVGAGTGSYEPAGLDVVAVEPSGVMLAQRSVNAAPAVQGVAEALPFPSGSFDAALAVLTVHHWGDKERGLAEMCRVSDRRVILTSDRRLECDFWLVGEYLPELADVDYGPYLSPEDVAEAVGAERIEVVPVPHDCWDGFGGAHWRRPAMYLDPSVRACISSFPRLNDVIVQRFVAQLSRDLESGAWDERHRDLLDKTGLDLGYRLVVAGGQGDSTRTQLMSG